MLYHQFTTLRLTVAPEEIGSQTRKAYDILWETFGNKGFHPLEAQGVLIALMSKSRSEASAVLQNMYTRGFMKG